MKFPPGPIAAVALALWLLAPPARAQDVDAKAWLSAALADPARADAVLTALRVSGDRDAAPIFGALTRSADRSSRLAATAAIARLAPQEAVPFLLERLEHDTLFAIRAEALAHLLEMKAVSAGQLQAALRVDDDNVRCLAGRGLLQLDRTNEAAKQAATVLRTLTASKDLPTACLARMSLLGLDDASQLSPLDKLLQDPATPDAVVALTLQQAIQEKIRPAASLAQAIATTPRGITVRVMAYKAASSLSDAPAATLARAVESNRDIALQVHLVNLLAAVADNQEALVRLAGGQGTPAVLARLELDRAKKDPHLGQAISDALALEHPVVIDYVLDRAGKDIEALGEQADAYRPALVEFIRSTDSDTREMSSVHVRTARAATLLCDLGTPSALASVRELLGGRHKTVVQAVTAGMRWSKNKAVCDIARTMLANPYHNVAADAALTLGMFGDPDAAAPLKLLLARSDREPVTLITMACWYLLKIEGHSAQAGKDLAAQVK